MSDATKRTPGPWSFGYTGMTGYGIYGGGQHIATSILYKRDGGEANARLIAAAPELLEALKNLRSSVGGGPKFCGHDYSCICAWDASTAAIAKAEGRS